MLPETSLPEGRTTSLPEAQTTLVECGIVDGKSLAAIRRGAQADKSHKEARVTIAVISNKELKTTMDEATQDLSMHSSCPTSGQEEDLRISSTTTNTQRLLYNKSTTQRVMAMLLLEQINFNQTRERSTSAVDVEKKGLTRALIARPGQRSARAVAALATTRQSADRSNANIRGVHPFCFEQWMGVVLIPFEQQVAR